MNLLRNQKHIERSSILSFFVIEYFLLEAYMNDEQAEWYLEGKYYLLMNLTGIELLKKHLVNADKLFQSEIYKHELPYVMMKELGSDKNNISNKIKNHYSFTCRR